MPERVLRATLRRGVWHVLVQWEGMDSANATWEPLDAFRAAHPSFQLEDELFVEGGEMLWSAKSIQGARRGRPNSRLSACSSRIRISKIS
jgi:hypothetical protein